MATGILTRPRILIGLVLALAAGVMLVQAQADGAQGYETVTFASGDGLEVSADWYAFHVDPATPVIVLCHQAGWSRGEYREIAPRLGELGFNCLALDQRSGGRTQGVANLTARRAESARKATGYTDAEQDIVAGLAFAREHHAQGPVLLWGSSYSASLALRIAGEHQGLVDGVLAFSPGEYFEREGKAENWIERSAAKIAVPMFITSARKEARSWKKIHAAVRGEAKTGFVPQTKGQHGSRALWPSFDDSAAYWQAVEAFLAGFQKPADTR